MSFIPTDYSQIRNQLKSGGNSYWGGYYKTGVYGGTPTQKKMFSGRILPAFNYQLSQADSEFPTSWMPYRNADNVDPETNQPVLSAFFAVAAAYSWFGNKQVSFLSPSTLRFTHNISRGPELIDPIQDIRNFAKKHEDPAIRALCERAENKKESKIILPYPSRRYIFNFYGTAGSDRTERNYLIDVSQKAFEDLAAKLSEWRPAHEQILDQSWPNYLYGDITDPYNGILVETVSIPSSPQPFNGFVFTSGSHKSLKGVRSQPVTQAALAGRYHLYGDNSALKIMPAQEIVDFLVEDGSIPYHLIEEVCSNYANVPARPNKATVFPGADEEEDINSFVPPVSNPFSPQGIAAKTKAIAASHKAVDNPPWASDPAPTVKPTAPAPTTTQDPVDTQEEKYWVSLNGNVDDDVYSRSEVQNLINKNPGQVFMLCEQNSETWQSPVEARFTVAAVNKPKPPPLSAAKPAGPPPLPTPAMPPAAAPVIPQPVAAPAAAALSEEEQAELNQLKAMFDAGTLPTSDIPKYIKLVHKLEAAGK